MRLNVLSYNFRYFDGYGRYSSYLVRALQRAGVNVTPHFAGAADSPAWLREVWGVDFSVPTISCLPPYYLRKLPKDSAPHWLITMTEGSQLPDQPASWAKIINESGVSRVIVPCRHNAEVFRQGGVECPISVIHGGTDPDEFAPPATERPERPYTFLALADRGSRKGWDEVYKAFYQAFGGKSTGIPDVRLMIKSRPDGNALINDHLKHAIGLDPRIIFNDADVADMRDLYAQVDCFAIPSRSEGFGMPHREAAMMGLPVITQAYSGMDDGHTGEWAIVVAGGRMEPIPKHPSGHVKGEYRLCDVDALARIMWRCYQVPAWAQEKGQAAAQWLRANQTWDHSADALLALLHSENVLEREYA